MHPQAAATYAVLALLVVHNELLLARRLTSLAAEDEKGA